MQCILFLMNKRKINKFDKKGKKFATDARSAGLEPALPEGIC